MKITTWDIRRSGFPFTTHGQLLDTVEAPTSDAAREAAELTYGGRITVEPARPTSEKLEKAIAKLSARRPRSPYAGPRRRAKPMEPPDE